MMFARNPNGGITAVANGQRPQPQPGRQPQQRQVPAEPNDGLTAHLRARVNALEQQNAGLNVRLSKMEQAFALLVRKLAGRAAQPQPQQTTQSGARVPEVVEFGGAAAQPRQGRSFDQEIEDAIAMSGGDDDENPFG